MIFCHLGNVDLFKPIDGKALANADCKFLFTFSWKITKEKVPKKIEKNKHVSFFFAPPTDCFSLGTKW